MFANIQPYHVVIAVVVVAVIVGLIVTLVRAAAKR